MVVNLVHSRVKPSVMHHPVPVVLGNVVECKSSHSPTDTSQCPPAVSDAECHPRLSSHAHVSYGARDTVQVKVVQLCGGLSVSTFLWLFLSTGCNL